MENHGVAEQAVDVKSIIHEIRLDIKEKGYSNKMLSFPDTFDQQLLTKVAAYKLNDGEDLERNLDIVLNTWNVQPDRPLTGNPLVVCVKKVIRKLLNFYIIPIIEDQNTFNHSMALLAEKNTASEAQVTDLLSRVAKLEAREREGGHGENCPH